MKIEDFTIGKEFQVVEPLTFSSSIGNITLNKGLRVTVDFVGITVIKFHENQSGIEFYIEYYYLLQKNLDKKTLTSFTPFARILI